MKANKKILYFLLLSLFTNSVLVGQTPSSRFIFDTQHVTKNYTTPTTTTAKALSSATPTANVEINFANTIAPVLKTQYGVNTPFRNGWDQRTRSNLYNGIVTAVRFPTGSGSNQYFFNGTLPSSTENVIISGASQAVTKYNGTNATYMSPNTFISFKNDINGQAIVVVNYMYARYGITSANTRAARVSQAAAYAAAFVRKLNIDLAGNVKYWEIGNECYGAWEQGYNVDNPSIGTLTGTEYGEDFCVFVDSMKAIDPTIKCGVVVNEDAGNTWNSLVLPKVKNHADFLSVHNYFTTVAAAADFNNILNATSEIQTIKTQLETDIVTYTGNPADYYPIAMTEFNSRGAYNCTMINGLFISEILGEVIKNKYGLVSLWVSEWNWDAATKDCKGFLAKADPDQSDYTARQAYVPYYYYSKCFGNNMVSSTSSNTDVKIYASTFTSGEIGCVLINKSASTQEVSLKLSDNDENTYLPKTIYWYEFYANTIQHTDPLYKRFYINGQTSTENGGGPTLSTVNPYLSSYVDGSTMTLKPYSVIYFVIKRNDIQVIPDYSVKYRDGFERAEGYLPSFLVNKQTTWATYNATNNINPNTDLDLVWQDIYCTGTVAEKTYYAQAYADQRTGGTGTQCMKLHITDAAFGATNANTVRLRGLPNKIVFNPGETTAKYEVSLWARVDGTSKPVIKTNTTPLTITSTWTKYTIEKYVTGTTATNLAIDFVPMADNTDYDLYIDDLKVKDLVTPISTSSNDKYLRFIVSPNPAKDLVKISCNEEINEIQIFDIKGKKVGEYKLDSSQCFDVNNLAKGLYFINGISDTEVYKTKLLIK